MKLREAIEISSSLKFMIESLKLQSGIGRQLLTNQEFCYDAEKLKDTFDSIQFMIGKIEGNNKMLDDFNIKLCRIKDIGGSVERLKDGSTLDDIELFEVKNFCILAEEINLISVKNEIAPINIPNMQAVIRILDPDGTNSPTFYIYDAYSTELAKLRKLIKAFGNEVNDESEALRMSAEKIEDRIRQKLSEELHPFVAKLSKAIREIASLDILLSKSIQAIEMNLCEPVITTATTSYSQITNPLIEHALKKSGKRYQAIDIDIHDAPCLITGANMAGKTVLLKTVALAQYLAQFGFYIPAKEASVCLVDKVMLCMEDKQNELSGLSSYAAEILEVNKIIKEAAKNRNILVLIDELAKTTNPVEGSAIVNAVLEVLDRYKVRSLITTHYGNIHYQCRRLRVKGLKDDCSSGNINEKNINDYIDYSLMETESTEVPREAVRIAEILGVDGEFIARIREELTIDN